MQAQIDPDAELMMRVKRGENDAFELLVEKYRQPVINMVYRTLSDATEAEDVAQTVFIQAYKSAARYRPTAKFSTWLFTIARNLSLNELRRRSRHHSESIETGWEESSEHPVRQYEDVQSGKPGDVALRVELEKKVEEALRALPEHQRTALMLFQQEELTYDEIGEIVGCSLSATKSLIFRARETVKKRLKPYLETGAWEPGIEGGGATLAPDR